MRLRSHLRVERLEDRTVPSVVTWTGAAGDNNWDSPGNWTDGSTSRLPGSGDDVQINTSGITVSHPNAVTDSINSLTSQANIVLSGGALSIASSSSINSTLRLLGGGTLSGAGNITLGGPFDWL